MDEMHFSFRGHSDPAGWPEEVVPVFESSVTCSYATLTAAGRPITWPITPYPGEDGRTIDISTGLTYPFKAERARSNPKVGLLFADPLGSGLEKPPLVIVKGEATVRDADLQAGADRYARLSIARLPAAWKGTPRFLMRAQKWYWSRIWILVTPLEILWWPEGRMTGKPKKWKAPAFTFVALSDPRPEGRSIPVAATEIDQEKQADLALEHLGLPHLTVVDDGYPVPLPTEAARRTEEGFYLTLPPDVPVAVTGDACLTFQQHAEVFDGQRNSVFLGTAEPAGDETLFRLERALPDFSLGGSRIDRAKAFSTQRKRFAPRLEHEAQRRGQAVPKVNL